MSVRNPAVLGVWGPDGTRPLGADSYWQLPARWQQEAFSAGECKRVFCGSLMDIFEDRPDLTEPRERVFRIAYAKHALVRGGLKWMFLTKRPENIMRLLRLARHASYPNSSWASIMERPNQPPIPSWWFGCTVENQRRAKERLPYLLSVNAELRFLSVEPLLEPVDLTPWLQYGIGWVIVGGESNQGKGRARPFDLDALDSLIGQCRQAKVPIFVKQLGSLPIIPGLGLLPRLKDKHGGNPEEWPEALRIREIPKVR